MIITKEIHNKAILKGACSAPNLNQSIEKVSFNHLCWADGKILTEEQIFELCMDYAKEYGLSIQVFNAKAILPLLSGDGSGDGSGYGDGSGDGSGYGYGYGDGSGYGYGYGYGYGDGSGYGYGYGSGDGYGDGDGSGYGYGYGDGSGYGYGYGDGSGDGSGDGLLKSLIL